MYADVGGHQVRYEKVLFISPGDGAKSVIHFQGGEVLEVDVSPQAVSDLLRRARDADWNQPGAMSKEDEERLKVVGVVQRPS